MAFSFANKARKFISNFPGVPQFLCHCPLLIIPPNRWNSLGGGLGFRLHGGVCFDEADDVVAATGAQLGPELGVVRGERLGGAKGGRFGVQHGAAAQAGRCVQRRPHVLLRSRRRRRTVDDGQLAVARRHGPQAVAAAGHGHDDSGPRVGLSLGQNRQRLFRSFVSRSDAQLARHLTTSKRWKNSVIRSREGIMGSSFKSGINR